MQFNACVPGLLSRGTYVPFGHLNSRFCLQKLRSPKNILLQNKTLTGMKRFLLLNMVRAWSIALFPKKIIRKSFVLYIHRNILFQAEF